MKLNGVLKRAGMLLLLLGLAAPTVNAAPKAQKWLVLEKITYQTGVDKTAFEGIDNLLLTKLVQANKYKCIDRETLKQALVEEGLGSVVEIKAGGYSMRGEIVQLLKSGKARTIQNTPMFEYIATISLRANDLRTQHPYEAETLRVTQYCQTPKDMLVYVVQRIALAMLMRDYPMYIMGDPDDDEIDPEDLTLSYGADFINKGEMYEVRRRKALVDDDTGETVYKEKVVAVCEVTDVGKNTSTARVLPNSEGKIPKVKFKDVLRFYDNAEPFAVPSPVPPPPSVQPAPQPAPVVAAPAPSQGAPVVSPYPRKKPRIAVAPFISKYQTVDVFGTQLSTRTWMDDAADHLNIYLTQCGSFRVLDRSFGPEIDNELKRITDDPNASPNDVCRLSNKLATDYLVVAELMFSPVVSPGKDFVTGLWLPPPSGIFVEVRFRCVMAPTTEIAWSDIVRLDAQKFGGGTPQLYSSNSASAGALAICDAIQNRLDPAGFARVQAARAAAAAAQPPPPPPPPPPVSQPVVVP